MLAFKQYTRFLLLQKWMLYSVQHTATCAAAAYVWDKLCTGTEQALELKPLD